MNEQRAKRLDAKYGTVSVSSGKKQLDIGRLGLPEDLKT